MRVVFLFLFITLIGACHSPKSYEEVVTECFVPENHPDLFVAADELKDCLIGIKAPDFSMTNIDGQTFELSDLKGDVVVLNFWFMACPPCIAEIPALNDVSEMFSDQDVRFIGLASDTKDKLEKKFFTKHEFKFETIPDADGIVMHTLKSKWGYPTTMILDKEGIIRHIFTGAWTAEEAIESVKGELIPAIESLLDIVKQ